MESLTKGRNKSWLTGRHTSRLTPISLKKPRYCTCAIDLTGIQPAHLYLGTPRDNVEDREARIGKLDPDILGPMPPGGIDAVADRLRVTVWG